MSRSVLSMLDREDGMLEGLGYTRTATDLLGNLTVCRMFLNISETGCWLS